MNKKSKKMGFNATWSMAVGGMVGGGIFSVLSYDYSDIKNPKKTLPKATLSAVIAVIGIYVLVSTGATIPVRAYCFNPDRAADYFEADKLVECRK